MIIAMTDAHPDRVTLEFEPGDPIKGRLLDREGAKHPFHGWLELCAEIERAWKKPSDGTADGSALVPQNRGERVSEQ
jgi:hypothetical protein